MLVRTIGEVMRIDSVIKELDGANENVGRALALNRIAFWLCAVVTLIVVFFAAGLFFHCAASICILDVQQYKFCLQHGFTDSVTVSLGDKQFYCTTVVQTVPAQALGWKN